MREVRDPVVWVNPAQPPSVSRCAPRSRSPVSPDRPYKILLVQVGTLSFTSFSHPLFGYLLLQIFLLCGARPPSGAGSPVGLSPISRGDVCSICVCTPNMLQEDSKCYLSTVLPSHLGPQHSPPIRHPTLGRVFPFFFLSTTVYTRRDARPLPPKATDDSGELHTISRGALPQTTNPQDLI